jgi:hypothetical protein
MRTILALVAVTLGGVLAFRCLPRESRDRLNSAVRHRIIKRMEHMMASLPEDAPPKLVMSILPKLKAQNDQILAMLQEQNELLRSQKRPARQRSSEG